MIVIELDLQPRRKLCRCESLPGAQLMLKCETVY